MLLAHDTLAERPVRTLAVPLEAELLWQIQHDRDRQHVVLAGQGNQWLAGLRLDVCRVNDGQLAGSQSL